MFTTLEAQMLDTEPDNNHVFSLIKALALAYCKIRMHHLVKQQNTLITGNKIKKTMSKLILLILDINDYLKYFNIRPRF